MGDWIILFEESEIEISVMDAVRLARSFLFFLFSLSKKKESINISLLVFVLSRLKSKIS